MIKTNLLFNIFLCFSIVILISVNCCSAGDELEQVKNRRGGTVGLFAFPRVGRSDSSLMNWNALPNSYEEYEDSRDIDMKRSELIPFPRVGRAENFYRKLSKLVNLQNLEKRTGTASANSGLWFGPRLGRIQKRNTDLLTDTSSTLSSSNNRF